MTVEPVPRRSRFTIRSVMIAIALVALTLSPLIEVARGPFSGERTLYLIAVDFVVVPVVAVVWARRAIPDKRTRDRVRAGIWATLLLAYLVLLGTLAQRAGLLRILWIRWFT